jgi:RNase P subunit RPR2
MSLSRSGDDQQEDHQMKKTTCAACDCELGTETITVKLGGKTVEVCCQECAEALNEAEAATSAASNGKE